MNPSVTIVCLAKPLAFNLAFKWDGLTGQTGVTMAIHVMGGGGLLIN